MIITATEFKTNFGKYMDQLLLMGLLLKKTDILMSFLLEMVII